VWYSGWSCWKERCDSIWNIKLLLCACCSDFIVMVLKHTQASKFVLSWKYYIMGQNVQYWIKQQEFLLKAANWSWRVFCWPKQGIFSALDGKVVEFVVQKLKNVLSVTRESTNGGMLWTGPNEFPNMLATAQIVICLFSRTRSLTHFTFSSVCRSSQVFIISNRDHIALNLENH